MRHHPRHNQHHRPVLYSFRRCPYAMRARMALYVSGIRCELREVVLRDKPRAMLDVSPKGTVPVLVLASGQVLEESPGIMLWALRQNDPAGWLSPTRGSESDMMALIARNDGDFKDNLDCYKYADRYAGRYAGADALHHRREGEKFLRLLDARLQNAPGLFGERLCLADMAIAPFVRQFANTDRDWFDGTPYAALQSWLDGFLASPLFTAIMDKYAPWREGDDITLSPVQGPVINAIGETSEIGDSNATSELSA